MSKMENSKAAGPNKVKTELEDFGIEKLTECIKDMYDTGDIPEDLSKSIFIAPPRNLEQ